MSADANAWRSSAACRLAILRGEADAKWWFPEVGEGSDYESRQAKRICRSCPVIDDCLAASRREHGIWAGKAEKARRGEQVGRPLSPAPVTHGTDSNYSRGCRCGRCREAHMVANRERRWSKRLDVTRDRATVTGRAGGLKGGRARARALTPERRSEIARQAALARWAKRDEAEQTA